MKKSILLLLLPIIFIGCKLYRVTYLTLKVLHPERIHAGYGIMITTNLTDTTILIELDTQRIKYLK